MTKEHFNRERLYLATLAIARTMQQRGLMTAEELNLFDTKIREKYQPLLGSLYPVETAKNLDFAGV